MSSPIDPSATRRPAGVGIVEFAAALRVRSERQEAYGRGAASLVDALEAAGIHVDRLVDLTTTRRDNARRATPILIDWLTRVDNPDVVVDIAAALANPYAAPATLAPLVDRYQATDGDDLDSARVRAAICTTLASIADDTIADDLVTIATDTRFGTERGMAIVALGNLDAERHRAIETLTALLEDTTVTLFAVLGLAKAGAREATAGLLAATRHPNPIVRSTIRTTLRRWAASDGFG